MKVKNKIHTTHTDYKLRAASKLKETVLKSPKALNTLSEKGTNLKLAFHLLSLRALLVMPLVKIPCSGKVL